MIIVLRPGFSEAERGSVLGRAGELGCSVTESRGGVVCVESPEPVDPGLFEGLPGVAEVLSQGHERFPLAGREGRGDTVLDIGGAGLGSAEFAVAAGPCSVENEEALLRCARAIKAAGACLLRAGAFKPRTSPYAFQGLGERGLDILRSVRKELGLPVVTEAVDVRSLEKVVEAADVVQIGARSMQNFPLLQEAGRAGKPVLLKRAPSASLEEWLLSAEYLLKAGNGRVILCERGARSASDPGRAGLDLGYVLAARERTHLPVIVDPSHATGRREWVPAMAKAAMAAGSHGVIVEVHERPEASLSDSRQSLSLEQFKELMDGLRAMAPALGRRL